jgi:hypothetical protein
MGASPLTINTVIDQSVSDDGAYFEELPIPLSAWRLNTGLIPVATGAGIVGVAAAATSLMSLAWNATADATDIIRLDTCLPNQFAIQRNGGNGRNANPKLILRVKCRLRDTSGSASPNADLALTCQAFWHKDGATALATLGTPVSVVIGAADFAEADEEGFVWRDFDITGAMTAAQLAALDGSESVAIQLYPNEAVGTALEIQMIATKIKYLRHATLRTPAMRA